MSPKNNIQEHLPSSVLVFSSQAQPHPPPSSGTSSSNPVISSPRSPRLASTSTPFIIPINVKESYFLDQDHRHFDANFFNIKAVEVSAIDPQQRLLMEVVYEAIDAASLSVESLSGTSTGVFVGLMCADYGELINRDGDSIPTYTGTDTARSIMSNRISYWLNTSGPSTTIDTACSSSLVAVDQAVQLLLSGQSRVAIAAGANMILGPLQYVGTSKLHMLAPDGRSRMCDAKASGYARARFSGIDSSTPENDAIPYSLAIIVSQAVDERFGLFREPLSAPALQAVVDDEADVVLVGG
ncbi:beta-ketoacyl synthase [Podospora fimiseda]|uniref:Beta-ketoacyl synthase n=1 Tax=Podospora fimiseda TaxID=252190 RepID=A0AAN7BT91_9PEZI|nr:beta-ketoacyl synthase [Podospora fimiseda]